MTKANYQNNARKEAYKHFGLEIRNAKGLVLHHKDKDLINKDIDRYNEWRPEDFVVLTREEHARIHHSGAKRPQWVCDKISKANKGRKNNFTFYKNIETGETISVKDGFPVPDGFVKGRILKEESIKKMAESRKGSIPWNKGIKMSEEQRAKQKGKNAGRFVGGKSTCSKKVNQYTLDGSFIKCWDSLSDIFRELGINRNKIRQSCIGKRYKTYKGFIWKYA